MQKLLVFLCLFVTCGSIDAQNSIPSGTCVILYSYDAAGNRTKQEYFCNNTGSPIITNSVKQPGQDGKIVAAMAAASDNSKTATTEVKSATFLKVDALYPNPTTGRFTVTFAVPLNNATIFVTDAGGKAIQQKGGYSGSSLELDLSSVASGVYFIRIPQPDGKSIIHKVVKQ